MTARIEGVDALVAFFGGSRRWKDWHFEPMRVVSDEDSRTHVAEIHGRRARASRVPLASAKAMTGVSRAPIGLPFW